MTEILLKLKFKSDHSAHGYSQYSGSELAAEHLEYPPRMKYSSIGMAVDRGLRFYCPARFQLKLHTLGHHGGLGKYLGSPAEVNLG